MKKVKYIITDDFDIIVFPETIQHKEFKYLKPISAGFISFSTKDNGELDCQCYGESISLKLKSRPDKDTKIAKRQLNIL